MSICNFKEIQKILIPTDGSAHSACAAECGISVAKMLGAEIMVVNVIDEVVIDLFPKGPQRENVEQELKQDGQRYIKQILDLVEKEGIKGGSLLTKGRPFEQIVHLAKDLDIDLIVMGTSGRGGANKILIGSVTERVIEYSPCPVLVVK